jgi:hypothetical protein
MQTTQLQQDFEVDPTMDLVTGNDRYAGDSQLYKQFFTKTKQDIIASREAQRPIFYDAEYVTLMVPGDRTLQVTQEVDALIKQRFPREYAAFKAGIADQITGTPLDMLPGITPSRAEEYRHIGFKTIEMLANASDANSFMGFQADKKKAIQYLAIAEGKSIEALDQKLSAENAALQQTIADMQTKLEQLAKAKAK